MAAQMIGGWSPADPDVEYAELPLINLERASEPLAAFGPNSPDNVKPVRGSVGLRLIRLRQAHVRILHLQI